MLDFEMEELNESTDWREVLAGYLHAHQSAQAAAKNTEEGFDGWLPRIMDVEGLESEDLPRLHGKLIALGFLKFQLASRGTGVVYQISPAGRQALNNIVPDESDSGDEENETETANVDEDASQDPSQIEQPAMKEREEASSQEESLSETPEDEHSRQGKTEEVTAQMDEEIQEAA